MNNQINSDEIANSDDKNQSKSNENQKEKDWFLSHFVRVANRYGSEVGVTLNVSGTIITGTIVSGADYFIGFADDLASAFPKKEDADNVRASFSENAKLYPRAKYDDEGNEIDEGDTDQDPDFIHLRDAKFILNGQPALPSNRGIWWRGKLSSIDGFNLGTIRVE